MIELPLFTPLVFTYTNWRNVTAERTVIFLSAPRWGSTEWHPEPQWLIEGLDTDNMEVRDWAVSGIRLDDVKKEKEWDGKVSEWAGTDRYEVPPD